MIWTLFILGCVVCLDGVLSQPKTVGAMLCLLGEIVAGAAMMAGALYLRHVGFK